tara:strand:- start:20222 stop:20572 length:351 start_codon:yes stop_codon:yes gene_type:complete
MSKQFQTPPPALDDASDRRMFRRIATRIEGRIVFAGVDTDCIIHEMSATGAIVECLPMPAAAALVALDVPHVGFARGHVIRHMDNLTCIALDAAPDKRNRMTDKLILAAFNFPPDK